jgi:hypothetical protein
MGEHEREEDVIVISRFGLGQLLLDQLLRPVAHQGIVGQRVLQFVSRGIDTVLIIAADRGEQIRRTRVDRRSDRSMLALQVFSLIDHECAWRGSQRFQILLVPMHGRRVEEIEHEYQHAC